jgi:hypothetical protein
MRKRKKTEAEFLALLPAPARRALECLAINSLKRLSEFTEKELLAQHGLGPGTIPKLKKALGQAELALKK